MTAPQLISAVDYRGYSSQLLSQLNSQLISLRPPNRIGICFRSFFRSLLGQNRIGQTLGPSQIFADFRRPSQIFADFRRFSQIFAVHLSQFTCQLLSQFIRSTFLASTLSTATSSIKLGFKLLVSSSSTAAILAARTTILTSPTFSPQNSTPF